MAKDLDKTVPITGTVRVGNGKEIELRGMSAICHISDPGKVWITVTSHGRCVLLEVDWESALRMANRIIDEVSG
jgi:hypothetical protein